MLGIETSCDDTSIAIIKGDTSAKYAKTTDVLAFESFSQEKMLSEWGGVVPEIASRNHLQKLAPLLDVVIKKANVNLKDIDLIGVTTFPGLLGPLLTGLNAAKTISLLYKKNLIPVNHLFAHLEAIHISEEVSYPYLGLLVSGGHSLFTIVSSPTQMEVLGSTIDDAAGEAFDKGGKLMGLGYPAGRIIDELAKLGNKKAIDFPVALTKTKNCNLSYSGLKTSLRHHIEKNPHLLVKDNTQLDSLSSEQLDVIASYQDAIVRALRLKLKYALIKAKQICGQDLPIVVGGGVACNSHLRESLKEKYNRVHFVEPKYCTDNGAMIANYALRTHDVAIPFPESLSIDARSRFIDKKEMRS